MNVALKQVLQTRPVVLVLEDEPLIALDLQFALEDYGAEVHLAATCEDAHSVLDQFEVQAAVLDINLGRGETCAKVATTLRGRDVPFILHTADLDRQGETIRSLDAQVVPKPTPAKIVAQTILGHLGRN